MDFGVEIEIVYRFWVLRSGSELVVVDTGPPLRKPHRRHLSSVRDVDGALQEVGAAGADVRTVLLTHLHWDHAANAAKFPNATFSQRLEIEFFGSHAREHPSINRFFSHQEYLGELIARSRIRPIDGDTASRAGLKAIRVGGHTPGSQMLVVDTAEGTSVLSGDAIPLGIAIISTTFRRESS
jgi:glyoxylase-like metal-dependent hydrolase (beta-lactamase superfamily II)